MTRVIGLSGWSGAGKTTLIVRLIPVLRQRGFTVSTVKHAHHAFDIDQPGKDSYEHRLAGAQEVLVASASRWALMHEMREAAEPSLAELLAHLSAVDLVLIEGFKRDSHPKIEVHRAATGKPYLYPDDPFIRAVATDQPESLPLPCLSLDDVEAIADLLHEIAMPLADLPQRG
ncbi:molybdopterin-guanine dinucleotide biosynthesis protein B [Beijerinckia mobilis]|uniref:molybdopterin-guanine dinucleotide biosynthesis protein B n=1 Tax=Beijerinckia mobilis TaxID=231434 RepID=UPI000553F047|nr:molybdopterin-guanine dinucleotide biosynthesis protein B [Beijerinckia mobilis]